MLLIFFITITGCERITDSVIQPSDMPEPEPLKVMTYNVYVGSSADPILNVENLLEVPGEVAKMYNNVIAADFPGRAAVIANIINTHQPHLIGLQEIVLIRRQDTSDFLQGNPTLAEDVVLDYLQILMDALKKEGLNYRLAAQVENLDAEMPMLIGSSFVDMRLTDYDVILARDDVEVSNAMSANYENSLTIEKLGLSYMRGYAAVDATVSGITYRVVNTHLEAVAESIRVAQTQELVDTFSDETLPIIMMGDFNTRATDGTGYNIILSAGYVDLWQTDSMGSGNTCCQDDDILNPVSDLTVRIDQIFARNLKEPYSVVTRTVGDKAEDRLDSGLWPSDHAGVLAEITYE